MVSELSDIVDLINFSVDWDEDDYRLLHEQMLSEIRSVKSVGDGDLVDFGEFQIFIKNKEVKDEKC